MIDLETAWEIARSVDPEADRVIEFEKGYLFMRHEQMDWECDPGFAVAKEDGKVLFGFGARVFLYGLQGSRDFGFEEEEECYDDQSV